VVETLTGNERYALLLLKRLYYASERDG